MSAFTLFIDWAFQLLITMWNYITASWLLSIFALIVIIGFIVDLVIATRSQ